MQQTDDSRESTEEYRFVYHFNVGTQWVGIIPNYFEFRNEKKKRIYGDGSLEQIHYLTGGIIENCAECGFNYSNCVSFRQA